MSFNIGVSALTANQAALQVVGHNIANANTPGYSRQNVSLDQIAGQRLGNGFFGKGVTVASVERAYSQFLTREANLSKAAAEAAGSRYQRLQSLEQLFPIGDTGLGRQLNGYLNAWADVVSSPTNQTARGVVLTRADEFANRLNQTDQLLDEMRTTTRIQIETGIEQANRIAKSIAEINQRVTAAFSTGRPPNDLLDQRDLLVAELNQIVQVTTLEMEDRSLTVLVAGSLPMVMANRATSLVGSDSIDKEGRYTIGFGNAQNVIDDTLMGGGELKGALSFFNDDVANVRNQLGRIALTTIELTNRQHRQGLDLNGNPGGDFFRPVTFQSAVIKLDQASPAALALSVSPSADAPTRFQASDYAVRYVGTDQVQIQRLSDGAFFDPVSQAFASSTPLTATFAAAPANFIEFDGLRLTQTASGNANDQIVLKPMTGIANQLKVALTSPSQLAIASPVLVEAGADNSDNLQVESLFRPAGSPAFVPTTISFVRSELPPSSGNFFEGYVVNGVGDLGGTPPGRPFPFVSGQPIVVNGFSLSLRGQPAVGDTFSIRPPSSGESTRQNAGNGQALLALRDLGAIDGYTLSDGYIPVFAAVSSSIQVAKTNAEFTNRVAEQTESRRANQVGVNLDEEAARLLQYQQAYQSAAKYLQSLQSNFDTLLSAVGR